MISTVLTSLTIIFLLANLVYFFQDRQYKRSYFQSSLFQKLFFSMIGLTFGFAVLYYLMSFETIVLRVSTEYGRDGGEDFLDYLYFSGVTMLSVGYGDLVPVGAARFFALIQAGIGLLLPTAYFVRALDERGNSKPDIKEGQGNYSDKRSKEEEKGRENQEADK